MKILLLILITILSVVGLYVLNLRFEGISLIAPPYQIDISPSSLLLISIGLLTLLLLLQSFILWIFDVPTKLASKYHAYVAANDILRLYKSLTALLNGDLYKALKHLKGLSSNKKEIEELKNIISLIDKPKKLIAFLPATDELKDLQNTFVLKNLIVDGSTDAMHKAQMYFTASPQTSSANAFFDLAIKNQELGTLYNHKNELQKYIAKDKLNQTIMQYAKLLITSLQYMKAKEVLNFIGVTSPESMHLYTIVYIKLGMHNECITLLKKYWNNYASLETAAACFELLNTIKSEKFYVLAKRLYNNFPSSKLLLAKAALSYQKYDEASKLIVDLMEPPNSIYAYLLMIELCQKTHGNPAEIYDWLNRSMNQVSLHSSGLSSLHRIKNI